MGRSDSSDSEYEKRRRKKQKKDRYRSRSRSRSSSSSERSTRKHKSHKSSRGRSRSRSRDRKRSRSRSRDYRRSRSKSRDRKDRSYKRKDRSRSRSHEKDRPSRHRSELELTPPSKTGWDVVEIKDLKLTPQYVPTHEDIEKIDKESFVQQSFSSTISNSANMPKQKKKKKKGKNNQQIFKNTNQQTIENTNTPQIDLQKELSVSHENAIFGTVADTMHVGKFSSRISKERKDELKSVETDDLIFGAMFCEDPEVRMKRWIDKLTLIRERLRKSDQMEIQ